MSISRSYLYPSLLMAASGFADSGGASFSSQRWVDSLIASSRHDSIPAEHDIYAPFLGDWEITGSEYPEPDQPKAVAMSVHFSRVLDGRAIQDIWVWPVDGKSAAVGANRASGSTFRVYDPVDQLWRVTWLDPVKRNRVQLDAKRVGDDVVQLGTDARGMPRRWIFTDVAVDSFTWRGESSEDGGRTFQLKAEYFARRRR